MEDDQSITESTLDCLPTVRLMGTQLFDPFYAERSHSSDFCELLYVVEGNVRLVLDHTSYAAKPGDLLFIPPETIHRDEFDLDAGLRVFTVFFYWAGHAVFQQQVSNDFLLTLPPRQKRAVIAMLQKMQADVWDDSHADRLIVRSRLLTILAYLYREAVAAREATHQVTQRRVNRQRRNTLMHEAKAYLRRHYAEAISLVEIADALNVSSFHLSHVFSQESDFSLFAYLTSLRMEKALALLRERRMNISEVAHTVGYEDSSYFSKVFRKHFQCSPSDFLGAVAIPPDEVLDSDGNRKDNLK